MKTLNIVAFSFAVAFFLAIHGTASAQRTGTGTGATTGGFGTGTTGGFGNAGGTTGGAAGGTTGGTGNTLGAAQGLGTGTGIAGGTVRQFSDVGAAGAATGNSRLGGLGGLGGFGGRGGFGGGLSPFGLNPFGSGTNAADTKPTIRTRLRADIASPTPSPVAQVISQQRVSNSLRQPRFSGIGIQMQGGQAVLSGTVATEADRRMAELMLRLEPGVSQIDNQIVVGR